MRVRQPQLAADRRDGQGGDNQCGDREPECRIFPPWRGRDIAFDADGCDRPVGEKDKPECADDPVDDGHLLKVRKQKPAPQQWPTSSGRPFNCESRRMMSFAASPPGVRGAGFSPGRHRMIGGSAAALRYYPANERDGASCRANASTLSLARG